MKKVLFLLSLVVFFNANAQITDAKAAKEFKKSFNTAVGFWFDQNYQVRYM